MPRPHSFTIVSALFAGFCGSALFTAIARDAPAPVHHHHYHPAPPPAPAPVVVQSAPVTLPRMLQPVPTWALDGQAAALTVDRRQVAPGQDIAVTATAVVPLARDAWIGIIPSHVPHGDETENDQHDLSYQYLDGHAQRIFVFQAPDTPGRYDFRLHSTDAGGVELASITFDVVGY